MECNLYKFGTVVAPADGTSYQGVVIYASKDADTVKHQCIRTGKVYEKSYLGFYPNVVCELHI